MIKLRPYQIEAEKKIKEFFESDKYKGTKQLIVSPCGSGKSILVAAAAVHGAKRGGVLILQPSRELLFQNIQKLRSLAPSLNPTIYSSSAGEKVSSELTYATLGSVKNMGKQFCAMGIKTLILDEAQSGYAPQQWVLTDDKKTKTKKRKLQHSMYSKFLADLNPERVLGFTATPFRLKSNGMGNETMLNIMTRVSPRTFDDFLHIEQVQTMIDGNYWAPTQYKCYDFDEGLLHYNSSGTEFTEESISEANMKMNVNNNAYLEVLRILKEDVQYKILLFAESVAVARKFQEVIEGSRVVDSDTSKTERAQIVEEFKTGKTRVLINFNVFSIGFDEPSLSHVIMAKPTGSYTVAYQSIGRGVRLHPQGLPFRLIDLCGNIKRFGRLEDLQITNVPHEGWVATTMGTDMFGKPARILLTGVPVGSHYTLQSLSEIKQTKVIFKPTRMFPKGKFNGRNIKDVPQWYLKWCLTEDGRKAFASISNAEEFFNEITKYIESKSYK